MLSITAQQCIGGVIRHVRLCSHTLTRSVPSLSSRSRQYVSTTFRTLATGGHADCGKSSPCFAKYSDKRYQYSANMMGERQGRERCVMGLRARD